MRYQLHFDRKFYLDKKSGYWTSSKIPRTSAHRWVWINNHGNIPVGFHVHHIDQDKSNNSIENLQMLPRKVHLGMHMSPDRKSAARDMANKYRHLTKEWHSSPEGKKWHIIHGKETWKNREHFSKICLCCSLEFETKTFHQRFCSNKCKSKWRRDQKSDYTENICEFCNKHFMRNKYDKGRFCGKSCSFKCSWSEGKVNKKNGK